MRTTELPSGTDVGRRIGADGEVGIKLGAAVGRLDGGSEAVAVGELDGASVTGAAVGGVAEGVSVGASEGETVGKAVGVAAGASVGSAVASNVGCTEGAAKICVGASVGLRDVGASVAGAAVGAAELSAVGSRVGEPVTGSARHRTHMGPHCDTARHGVARSLRKISSPVMSGLFTTARKPTSMLPLRAVTAVSK
jgi:hypothetical protein